MPLDTSRTEPHPEPVATHETRRRLEHARTTSLTQLHALTENTHTDEQLMSTQTSAIQQTLQDIDTAFARLEAGTYGTCRTCGTSIPEERLEILPYTSYCVTCRHHTST
jgi:DnaK suppressor protein